MDLVPIPVTTEYLRQSEPLWLPFLERISQRTGEPVASLYDRIMREEVQPILVMDGKEARALCGVCFYMREDEKIAQWQWMTGTGRKDWEHLLPIMERFMADMGAAICEPVCRKGWSRLLKRCGYEITGHRDDGHVVMEKRLWAPAVNNSHNSL